MRPVIALLSDFGTRDHYAGTMKGVMLGICPDVTLVDITHDIPPHDVIDGALQLAAAYSYFPAGTIFLAVVDPGVGSARRGPRGRSRRLPVRRARQRRADGGPARRPAQAHRRADRAPLRAADREPHVRGARSLRAGRRLAGQGDPALGARPAGHDFQQLDIPRPRRTRRACAASCCASIGSATWSPTSTAGPSSVRRDPRRRH